MILIPQYRTARRASAENGILLTDLVAHWDLSEASGNRLDSVGSLHAVPSGSPTQVAGVGAGQYAYSQTNSPSTNGLVIPHSALLVPLASGKFVINWWQYRTGGGTYSCAFDKGNQTEYAVNRESGDAGWSAIARNSANTGRFITPITTDYANDAWFMVTANFDRVAEQLRLYLNGTLKKSVAMTSVRTTGTSDLYIGRGQSGSSTAVFAGHFQSLSIWQGDGAQNAIDNLAWLYNSGSAARLYADLQGYNP